MDSKPVNDIPKGFNHEAAGPCWLAASNLSGEKVKPHIKCQCGAIFAIDKHHVHATGLVTPSFSHDFIGCGWHVWLRLLDYDQGDFPAVK